MKQLEIPGLSLIYGPAASGKTMLLNAIASASDCEPMKILVDEPELREGWYYPKSISSPNNTAKVIFEVDGYDSFDFTGKDLIDGLITTVKTNKIVFVDSISSVLLRASSAFSTGKGGVNSGVFVYLAAINRVAIASDCAIYGVINPHLTDVSPDALEGVVQRVIERIPGTTYAWTQRGRFAKDRTLKTAFRPGMESSPAASVVL